MEKNNGKMSTRKIVITGPESTGKTLLTKQLAEHFSMPFISEIARDYVENLGRKYTKSDILKIAKLQIEAEEKILQQKPEYVFLDTDLVITKIWLLHLYGNSPKWIDRHLKENPAFYYLLCYYDIDWQYDPVRENPNIREHLYRKYKQEIERLSINYSIIKGNGEQRFKNAIKALDFMS
jgi:nicotinamide riboside kinase